MTKKMDEILARYFGGNASQKDMEALELWLSSDRENQQHFDELTILYRQIGCPDQQIPTPNVAQAKTRFLAYMDKEEQVSPEIGIAGASRPFYRNWMFQAASILILLTLSFSIWYTKYAVKDILLTTNKNKIEKVLPDGTRIQLSKNSSLSYRSNFGDKDKILHLSGEATIHAGHEGVGRLQILTDKLTIEDIGTIFTISAYPDSTHITVSVKEGQVSLFTEKHKRFRLKANEQCRFDKGNESFHPGNLEKNDKQTLSYQKPVLPEEPKVQAAKNPIKRYHYEFESRPLHDVVETISKDYGVHIGLESPGIGSQEITVYFDQEKLEIILEVVAETMNLKVKKVADGYVLCSK